MILMKFFLLGQIHKENLFDRLTEERIHINFQELDLEGSWCFPSLDYFQPSFRVIRLSPFSAPNALSRMMPILDCGLLGVTISPQTLALP
jgi:hypothetical protein